MESSDQYEEWMVESIRMYKDLHDFELQDATRVIEWIGEKSICVAGYDSTKTNEILQLLVPLKLQVSENQGLCPERDLKVEHGGFSQRPIYSLQHVSTDSSLVVTSSPGSSEVEVWQIGAEDKDVIKPISSIHSDADKDTWTKIATRAAASPQLLHGSQMDNVHLTDIDSKKRIYTLAVASSEGLGSLSFLDDNAFLLCGLSGRLVLADLRQPAIASEGEVASVVPGNSGHWIAAARLGHGEGASCIACLSSEGHMAVRDPRDLGNPLKCARRKGSAMSTAEEDFLCIRWAPRLRGCISVSGFDGAVEIYDTQLWDGSMKETEAAFTHRGHAVMGAEHADGHAPRVTCHSWHPWKERTLLSAANDGSFHIWDWLDGHSGL